MTRYKLILQPVDGRIAASTKIALAVGIVIACTTYI